MVRPEAAARTSGSEPATAKPAAAHRIIEMSLRPSPTAAVSAAAMPSRRQTNSRARRLSARAAVNSR